ncbi:UDP-N-acetylmuramoyl-L-alanine--D-glutamate ligase [Paraferrimonas haliotis]|uniref:UDP-N-acetylmuramoylalanine--D-glutamate ligase n=1 Tax=Paraferrimonas haliotis TaxID=2013866 RepID=A0AA37TUU7_9GAMM|nr:UDP-N-acetylmuramoyl-L-alanine--D-glutamate ligase [Paraferrimonas haliotis]GLS82196.1 UDP-N-acetylmuramoylalanine--D-glutamate ligase [Paraferrimonas haliotis]
MAETKHTHWVVGLGATGLSVVRYLCGLGITPGVCDSRMSPPGAAKLAEEFPQVELICGHFPAQRLAQAQQLIVSPGIAVASEAIATAAASGVEIVGDIELFARAVKAQDAKVIGITGSNGKSTVTSLLGEVLSKAGIAAEIGGNIGTPALNLLSAHAQVYVLELSSFQLETTTSLDCTAATILNVTEDHLDRYPDYAAYLAAKRRLYQQTRCIVANQDDPQTWGDGAIEELRFSVQQESDWYLQHGHMMAAGESIGKVDELQLIGRHNYANALAVLALAQSVGVSIQDALKTIKQYPGLAHRCQTVAIEEGIRYVNDSKATNVGATVAALDGLTDYPGNIYLIAGGDAKQADLTPLAKAFQGVKQVLAFGKDAELLVRLSENCQRVEDLDAAMAQAKLSAHSGDLILLSPACASLDMYPNFMARGDHFCQLVRGANG